MFSYFEPDFRLWEVFFCFQILAKIEMTRNETRLFGRHLETIQHFDFVFQNSSGKVAFLGGFHGTPPCNWAPTGVKVGLPWSCKC